MSNHNIIWEKWTDPFGYQDDDINKFIDNDADEIEQDMHEHQPKKINAIITSMGIIPYNEYTDCSKIFNFWIGHTNFDITANIADIIQLTEGVETLDIFSRYRFRVAFGKAFVDRDIMNNINININDYFNSVKYDKYH